MMKKVLLGIALILFGFNLTYIAVQAEWQGVDIFGLCVSIAGLAVSCTEFDAVMDKIDQTLPTAPVLRGSPSLVVTASETIIEALKGTSSWIYVDDNGDAAIMGDSNHPLLKKASTPILDLIPTYFSSGDPLGVTLQFGTAPNETTPDKVTVRCWPEECWGNTNAESEDPALRPAASHCLRLHLSQSRRCL